MLYPYNTSVGPDQTMDGLLTGRTNVAELIPRNDPLLSWNGVDVQCKLRPTEPEVASLGPEFQAAWNKDFKDMSDKPLMIVSIVSVSIETPVKPSPVTLDFQPLSFDSSIQGNDR